MHGFCLVVCSLLPLCCMTLAPPPSKVLVIGLDGSGKSTLIHYLKYREEAVQQPTLEARKELAVLSGAQILFTELGGGIPEDMRRWQEEAAASDLVLFVVDMADRSRIATAGSAIQALIAQGVEASKVVVVTQNIGLQGTVHSTTIRRELRLPDRVQLVLCCTRTGLGMDKLKSVITHSSSAVSSPSRWRWAAISVGALVVTAAFTVTLLRRRRGPS